MTKYLILLADGSADLPIERIGGRTPWMAANTPVTDSLAARGRTGTLSTVPEGMTPDSAVANLSVLGYDPLEMYSGRGVLEAASLGVELAPDDIAMRLNLIATEDGAILDHSSGHISTDEAKQLVEALAERLAYKGIELHLGNSYRHLLILRGTQHDPRVKCWPPHDHVGKKLADMRISATNPAAEHTAELLNSLTDASRQILAEHPVNLARRKSGKREAGTIWLWAPGRKPSMPTLEERFGIKSAVISAVDLIRGLGVYAGMSIIHVEGATGLYDTNYEGKARAALEAFEDHDLVFVHVEGPDEAGHSRDLGIKIKALESIDSRLLGPLLDGMARRGYKTVAAVLPDHLTPVERGDHVGDPVPVLICDPDKPADATRRFDEQEVKKGELGELVCEGFIEALLGK